MRYIDGIGVSEKRLSGFLREEYQAHVLRLSTMLKDRLVAPSEADAKLFEFKRLLFILNAKASDYIRVAQLFYAQSLYTHASFFLLHALSLDQANSECYWLLGVIHQSNCSPVDARHAFAKHMQLMHYTDKRWWDGQSECDILIVIANGVGESVIATRQCPELRRFASKIGICTKPHIIPLAKSSRLADLYIASNSPTNSALKLCRGNPDMNIQIVRTEASCIGEALFSHPLRNVQTLFADQTLLKYWASRIEGASGSGKTVIGLCWNTKPVSQLHPDRSFLLSDCEILCQDKENILVSFQNGCGSEQLESCSFQNRFASCQGEITSKRDFPNTLAAMANCDYFVTCDTGLAQISCALGVKTFVIVKHKPSAYWAGLSTSSSFYKAAYIHRIRHNETWQAGINRLFCGRDLHSAFTQES